MATYALLAFTVSCVLLIERRGLYLVDGAIRLGLVAGTGYVLRAVFYLSTTLPGSADHCLRGFPLRPPRELSDIFFTFSWPWQASMNSEHQCGDLIFSGHTMAVCHLLLVVDKYWASWFFSGNAYRLMVVSFFGLALGEAVLLVASRRHYTVDVLIALYFAPVHWFVCLHLWSDVGAEASMSPGERRRAAARLNSKVH